MVKTYYKKSYKSKKPELSKINLSANYLMIVESPSKCAKIEEYLGSQYCCISSKGHIQKLAGLSSIDTKNNYSIKYDVLEDKIQHIEWMKEVITKFTKSNIILASDDDREGEAIAWHICQVFDLDVSTTKRILFHEVTKPALLKAVQNPTIIDLNKVKAQQARQVLDMFIGYKVSPLLWRYLYRNKDNSLSAGRCQTPALLLVYDNELEQKTINIQTQYKIRGLFTQKKLEFELENEPPEDIEGFLKASATFHHALSIGSPTDHYSSPPKPFNTSTLLQVASSQLHMGPKETMSICQQLYQEGFITYMRTDSQKYSNVFIKTAKDYILEKFHKPEYFGSPSVTNETLSETMSENPHEAIRPTNINNETILCENPKAIKLYKLIWRTTIQSCMSVCKTKHYNIKITAPNHCDYVHCIEIPTFFGWRKLMEDEISLIEKGNSLLIYLQCIPQSNISYNSIYSNAVVKGRHSHYTEASLIKKLEDLGIGRPSTYAMIVDTNLERGYLKKMDVPGKLISIKEYTLNSNKEISYVEKEKMFGEEKNKLVIQPLGMMVAMFLLSYFDTVFCYDYTKNMEIKLDKIAEGNLGSEPWYSVCETCKNVLNDVLKKMKHVEKEVFSLKDNEEYKVVYEKYGPVLRKILEDGKYEYKSVKKELQLDLGRLKEGDYSYKELLYEKPVEEEFEFSNKSNEILVEETIGTCVDKTETTLLEPPLEKDTANKIIRTLNDNLSVRKGKYGAYIHYKTPTMKKPQFFNIQKFKESYKYCSEEVLLKWINETYKI